MNQYDVEVESKINTIKDDERDNCQYHRSCYSDAIHKGHTNRDRLKYEKVTSHVSDSDRLCSSKSSAEKTPTVFTRRNTIPFNTDLCFFCQNTDDEKGRRY